MQIDSVSIMLDDATLRLQKMKQSVYLLKRVEAIL